MPYVHEKGVSLYLKHNQSAPPIFGLVYAMAVGLTGQCYSPKKRVYALHLNAD